jgi:hypothetical protein
MISEQHKCTAYHPNEHSLFTRIMLFCGQDMDTHKWEYYQRHSKRMVYYCRRCKCGADQVQANGALGNKHWKTINTEWRFPWEFEDFQTAVEHK